MALAPAAERRLLQLTIAVGGCVPVGGGLAGALLGARLTGAATLDPSLDSHIRYLSGLLLGIGLAFWSSLPDIERETRRIRLLTALVVLGGLMRLLGLALAPTPHGAMTAALVMELGVTPAICLWQARVARRCDNP